MKTLLEILDKSADYFKSKGIENYRLDAQLILSHVLGLNRIDLYLNFDRPLKEAELVRCRDMVSRRGKREPLQHIVNETHFRNLVLKTDKRALVPRKETELIVDLVKSLIAKEQNGKNPRVLDMGTGTGAIALSLKMELPEINIMGVDISEECIELSHENAAKNGIHDTEFFTGDLFSELQNNLKFDVIVTNPPYVSEEEFLGLEPEVKDWDPKQALVGGPEGTEISRKLIVESLDWVLERGWLVLETGFSQAVQIKDFGISAGWQKAEIHNDYSDIPRFVAFQK